MIKCYSGFPGSGKSYILTHEAVKGLKLGKNVFTNYPVIHRRYGATYKLDMDSLKKCEFPHNSLLVIDEAGQLFNARAWKNFDPALYVLFTQHRHQGYDMLLGVQHPQRLDVSIREIVNVFYWVDNFSIPWINFKDVKISWFDYKGLRLPYVEKVGLYKKILFLKANGVVDLSYLGRKGMSRELKQSVVYDNRRYFFRDAVANSYDTLYLKKNINTSAVFEKWVSK